MYICHEKLSLLQILFTSHLILLSLLDLFQCYFYLAFCIIIIIYNHSITHLPSLSFTSSCMFYAIFVCLMQTADMLLMVCQLLGEHDNS